MDVTDVLRDRMHEPAGLRRMAVVSVTAHVLLLAALLLTPEQWIARESDEPRAIMTITLGGGGAGPEDGGMTQMGGRPVQVAATPEELKRPEAVRPPAARTPEMTVPEPSARTTRPSATPVKQAPDEARGRTPTRGAETREGSAIAETGSRGQGFGLSSGGGPGGGSTLDVADFCCPDYLTLMMDRIKSNWNQRQEIEGQTIVKFTIHRDGQLREIVLEKSSGFPILDLAAQRAVVGTRQLPPLPAAFPNPTLTVHLNFQYQR